MPQASRRQKAHEGGCTRKWFVRSCVEAESFEVFRLQSTYMLTVREGVYVCACIIMYACLCALQIVANAQEKGRTGGVLPPWGRSINIRSQVVPLSKGVL